MKVLKNLLTKPYFAIGIVLALTILAYSTIFPNQLIIDDHVFLKQWPGIKTINLVSYFTGDVPFGHEGVYRPIRSVLYGLYFQLWGESAFGYHLHSLIVHLVATLLVYFISLRLRLFESDKDNYFLAFVNSLLFGLHPVHTESITYMAASMDMTGIVFALVSFYTFLLFRQQQKDFLLKISVVFAWLGFFTYEMALPLVILILGYDLLWEKVLLKENWAKLKIYGWYWLGIGATFIFRFLFTSQFSRGPYLADSKYLTFLTMTKVVQKYFELLVWPLKLANNHLIEPGIEAFVYRGYQTTLIKAQTISDPAIVTALVLIGILLAVAGLSLLFRKWLVFPFALGWILVSLLPVLEIVPLGAILNERSLYLASFGFTLFVAWIFTKLSKGKLSLLMWGFLLVITGFYGWRTFTRNLDWRDDLTFWSRELEVYPQSAYAHYSLGNAYNDQEEFDKAIEQYQLALEDNPQMGIAQGSIGRTYAQMSQLEKAIEEYEKALEVDPNFYEVANNIGVIYKGMGDLKLARYWFEYSLGINPGYQVAAKNLEEIGPALPVIPEDWLLYESESFSFKYPTDWLLTEVEDDNVQDASTSADIFVTDPDKLFLLKFTSVEKAAELTSEEFLLQQEPQGDLQQEGLGGLPNSPYTWVRAWTIEDRPWLEFFLFFEETVVKVLMGPANSPLINNFDSIITSVNAK